MIVNAPSDTEYHLGKNLTQYSYTRIKDLGYKKTPTTFEVTSVCKLIEICGVGVI